ncbi:MAG TPA: nitric oxide synthase oxygenase [Streptosporangiaceae bacterium]
MRAADLLAGHDTELVTQATEFYALPEVRELVTPGRTDLVLHEIATRGWYDHTPGELLIGAKLAWRNHARCIGRYTWQSLKLLDARSCDTADEVAQACWEHLEISSNAGRLRPVITVFRARRSQADQIRIINPQLIRYAGYQSAGGRVTGDPRHVGLTRQAMALGWRGAGTRFDVLPLLIAVHGQPPALFPVPPRYVLEVPIQHPRFAWFEGLGLRWHANPAISDLCLAAGGLRYTAAPFSGWYVGAEIAARNLSDQNRYDMLPVIAERMGLDTSRHSSLWRDRALLELNEAVIFSYAKAGVYLVDHHTAAAQFTAHVKREASAGRSVPADWSWLVPPMSPSTTPVFHMALGPPDLSVRPNFVRQDELAWQDNAIAGEEPR